MNLSLFEGWRDSSRKQVQACSQIAASLHDHDQGVGSSSGQTSGVRYSGSIDHGSEGPVPILGQLFVSLFGRMNAGKKVGLAREEIVIVHEGKAVVLG